MSGHLVIELLHHSGGLRFVAQIGEHLRKSKHGLTLRADPAVIQDPAKLDSSFTLGSPLHQKPPESESSLIDENEVGVSLNQKAQGVAGSRFLLISTYPMKRVSSQLGCGNGGRQQSFGGFLATLFFAESHSRGERSQTATDESIVGTLGYPIELLNPLLQSDAFPLNDVRQLHELSFRTTERLPRKRH
jgi:hypothetical protein